MAPKSPLSSSGSIATSDPIKKKILPVLTNTKLLTKSC